VKLTGLNGTEPQRKALIRFWEAWQEELSHLRILDPAVHPKALDWQVAFPGGARLNSQSGNSREKAQEPRRGKEFLR